MPKRRQPGPRDFNHRRTRRKNPLSVLGVDAAMSRLSVLVASLALLLGPALAGCLQLEESSTDPTFAANVSNDDTGSGEVGSGSGNGATAPGDVHEADPADGDAGANETSSAGGSDDERLDSHSSGANGDGNMTAAERDSSGNTSSSDAGSGSNDTAPAGSDADSSTNGGASDGPAGNETGTDEDTSASGTGNNTANPDDPQGSGGNETAPTDPPTPDTNTTAPPPDPSKTHWLNGTVDPGLGIGIVNPPRYLSKSFSITNSTTHMVIEVDANARVEVIVTDPSGKVIHSRTDDDHRKVVEITKTGSWKVRINDAGNTASVVSAFALFPGEPAKTYTSF